MPAVGPSVRPCATGGRSAGRPACSGAWPGRRVSSPPCLLPCSAHQHACRPGTPRARVRSREPAGWLRLRTVPGSGDLPRAGWVRSTGPGATRRRPGSGLAAASGRSGELAVSPSGTGTLAYAGETGWLLAIGMLCQVTMPCDGICDLWAGCPRWGIVFDSPGRHVGRGPQSWEAGTTRWRRRPGARPGRMRATRPLTRRILRKCGRASGCGRRDC